MTKAPAIDLSAAAQVRPVIEMHGIGVGYRGQQPPAPVPVSTVPVSPVRDNTVPANAVPASTVAANAVPAPAGPAAGPAWPRWRHRARHRQSGRPAAALSGIELTVSAGEFITLTGPAGAGLSTLLAVAGLLLRPTAGTYLYKGIDTARLGDRDLAALRGREIGLVLDPAALLPGRPVLDNVLQPLLYASPPAGPGRQGRTSRGSVSRGRVRRSIAMECLDRVGLSALAGAQAGSLAAGERQRAAIARALVTSPGLLLLDDPTASLDPSGAATVIALLASLQADGTTIVASTRDQLAAAYSSRCVRIGTNRPGAARAGTGLTGADRSGTGRDRGEPSGEHRGEPSAAR